MILTGENRIHCHHRADKRLPQLHEAPRAFKHPSCTDVVQCLVSNFHQRGKSLDMPMDVGLLWNAATVTDKTIHTVDVWQRYLSLNSAELRQVTVCQRRFLVQYIWGLPSYYTIPGHRTGMEIKYSVHYIQTRVQNLIQIEHKKGGEKRTSLDITSWF